MSNPTQPTIRVPLIVFAGSRSIPAELWERNGAEGVVWSREPLDLDLRCDVMLEGISAGVPVLVRVVVKASLGMARHEGKKGHLFVVKLAFLRRSDQRKLDVWMRAAEASRRKSEEKAHKPAPESAQTKSAARSKQRARPRRPPPSSASVFPAGPRRVLLVEGGRSRADELAQALDPTGRDFEVESIWTLSELRARLAEGRVHLVLIDPDLPDSRGLTSVQEAVSFARGVPVVVLRGESEPGFEVKCLLAGAARVMRKETIGPSLARRVLALLGVPTRPRRRARPPVPEANPGVRQRRVPRAQASQRRAQSVRRNPGPAPDVSPVVAATAAPAVPKSPVPQPPAAKPAAKPAAPAPEPAAPVADPAPESMVAELWWHEEGFAAIWCSEALRIGLRCEMLLDPEDLGRPQLYRVEIVRAHHKRAPDGRNGFLHEAAVLIAPAQPVVTPPPKPAPPKAPPARRQAFRVVLVEHNPSFGTSDLRRRLGRMERVLIETRSSLAGLRARLRRGGVQLVFVELDLPDSEGLDTAQAALAIADCGPLVALSATPTPALEAGLAELGIAHLLGKDAGREDLQRVVEGFMEG